MSKRRTSSPLNLKIMLMTYGFFVLTTCFVPGLVLALALLPREPRDWAGVAIALAFGYSFLMRALAFKCHPFLLAMLQVLAFAIAILAESLR